jgi:small subunit ribosomal protein S21
MKNRLDVQILCPHVPGILRYTIITYCAITVWRNAAQAHAKGIDHLAQVIVKPGEGIDAALRRFKKQTLESGILKEARAHEHYEKPSDKRRREAAARMRKIMKAKRQAEARESR